MVQLLMQLVDHLLEALLPCSQVVQMHDVLGRAHGHFNVQAHPAMLRLTLWSIDLIPCLHRKAVVGCQLCAV